MASTYSSSLKIELITTGEQTNTWGTTTNTNLGTALEEAIVGRATANFPSDSDLTITLSNSNATQVARHFVLNVTSSVSLTSTWNLIVPTSEKPYIIQNNTTGGQAIVVKTSAGTGVEVPNGKSVLVYVDGTNVVSSINYIPSVTLGSALPVASGGTGVTSSTGSGSNVLSASPALTGTPTAPTATAGTNTTQLATTAFVTTAVSSATGSLGTMSSQNANNVAITGGAIAGTTITTSTVNSYTVGSNATGNKTISTGNPSGGSSGDVWYKV